MYHWYSRKFGSESWSSLFDRFNQKYMELGAPKHMFMVEDKAANEIFICVDSESLALHLDMNFKVASRKPPEENLSFLIGQGKYFEETLR